VRILVIGQTSLHWGRMEFGNIGNFYIIEPFFRELHKVFPNANIKTTFQMSDRFCKDEKIELLPVEYYYDLSGDSLKLSLSELSSAQLYSNYGIVSFTTPFIEEVILSDLVIDFSGDIWGDNADILGENRFLVGLIKDRVAQLFGKKTAMIAGSPGPFTNKNTKKFAQEVFKNFDLVTNREVISTDLLQYDGFDISRTKSLACPAFLFEPNKNINMAEVFETDNFENNGNNKVGFILCGWNFLEGPYDKELREDKEFNVFAEAVEYLSENIGLDVYLMSHSNGFSIPPREFKLKHGRDYHTIKQLQGVIKERGIAKNVKAIDNVYDAWTTKAILGNFDMLVSGRIHGAVGGLSQNVPTVIIDYGHEPKAHKLSGFAKVMGVEDYLADPAVSDDLITKIKKCWQERILLKIHLKKSNCEVIIKAKSNFTELKNLFI
jgi:colanic acid/amylovoran biosynthesis protein